MSSAIPKRDAAAAAITATAVRGRRAHMPLSIRLRLTLLYSGILALVLLLFGGALYITVGNITLNEAGKTLSAEAKSLISGNHLVQDGKLGLGPGVTGLAHTYIEFRNLTGTTTQLGDLKGKLPLDTTVRAYLLSGHTLGPSVVTMSGTQVLLYSALVMSDNGRGGDGGNPGPPPSGFYGPPPSNLWQGGDRGAGGPGGWGQSNGGPGAGAQHTVAGILQMAVPLSVVNGPLDALRPILLLVGLLATLLAFAVGWLVAGTALRPITRITATARDIGDARDFSRRVEHSGPRDEVGRLAMTFNTMLASLQDAYQTQRRFVADASHELRTPLTTIRGNLDLLRRKPPIDEPDREEVLDDLASESERLSRLIADLLTLARSDAGRVLSRDPVLIAPLFADLSRRLTAAYPGRAVEWRSAPEVVVAGDHDAVMQLLLILLDNALKFTPPSGTVAATATADKDTVVLTVADSGSGISAAALPYIFDRFYQSDEARTGTGTGLGLSIAAALAASLDGTVQVESTIGLGSTFTVMLPRALSAPFGGPVALSS